MEGEFSGIGRTLPTKKTLLKNPVVMDLESSQKSVAYCFAQNFSMNRGPLSDSKAGNEQKHQLFLLVSTF